MKKYSAIVGDPSRVHLFSVHLVALKSQLSSDGHLLHLPLLRAYLSNCTFWSIADSIYSLTRIYWYNKPSSQTAAEEHGPANEDAVLVAAVLRMRCCCWTRGGWSKRWFWWWWWWWHGMNGVGIENAQSDCENYIRAINIKLITQKRNNRYM